MVVGHDIRGRQFIGGIAAMHQDVKILAHQLLRGSFKMFCHAFVDAENFIPAVKYCAAPY